MTSMKASFRTSLGSVRSSAACGVVMMMPGLFSARARRAPSRSERAMCSGAESSKRAEVPLGRRQIGHRCGPLGDSIGYSCTLLVAAMEG